MLPRLKGSKHSKGFVCCIQILTAHPHARGVTRQQTSVGAGVSGLLVISNKINVAIDTANTIIKKLCCFSSVFFRNRKDCFHIHMNLSRGSQPRKLQWAGAQVKDYCPATAIKLTVRTDAFSSLVRQQLFEQ